MIRRFLSFTCLAVVLAAGCHRAPAPQAQSSYKTYKLRGKVISTDPSTGNVTLDHEAIPGFMDAMTMPYRLKTPSIAADLHPGDAITADLYVSQTSDADSFLDHINVVAQGKPDYVPATEYHVPAPGDKVPAFKLRNQDGRTISLDRFRGKSLLVTFIYTRCPLPNYCPLITRNFADINRLLAADPALRDKTHLLTISFDPRNDTPARLRAYGATYIGSDQKDAFAHWDFAVPDEKTLKQMALYFDLGLTPGPDSTITHSMSTTLIGPDGKVVGFYPSNDWTVTQVFADLKHSAGA